VSALREIAGPSVVALPAGVRVRTRLGVCGNDVAVLREAGWLERWAASRLFLTADREKDKAWGNETIRRNPDQNWLEIRLPAPLAHLAAPSRAKSTQARPRPTRRPGPEPGDPPPGRTHGRHQALRPESPDGPRQATRRPKTVRGRPPRRTPLCQATRNGSEMSRS